MSQQATPAVWEDVATEATEAVAAVIEPQVRKAADDLYARMMESVQDYLADNLRFNLSSRLETAEREGARLRKECWDVRNQRIALVEALKTISGMAPKDDPGPPEYDCGNSNDVAYAAEAQMAWSIAQIARAALKALGQDGESAS